MKLLDNLSIAKAIYKTIFRAIIANQQPLSTVERVNKNFTESIECLTPPLSISITVHRKILVGEKIGKSWTICQKFPHQYSDTLKTYLAYTYTDCSPFTKFFLANGFYLYGLPTFSRVRYVFLLLLYVYT